MYRLLTTLRRGFKERIGWKRLGHRCEPRHHRLRHPTLVRTLKGVDSGVILVALTEKSPAPDRARGAVRVRRVLHPDVL